MITSVVKSVELVEMNCGECGIVFGVPDYFKQERLATGKGWHCPNGHSRIYTSESHATKAKRLEAEVERLANDTKILRSEVWDQSVKLAEERTKRLTMQKRIRNGICPHCSRSFSDLKRHMETKHGEPLDRKHASQKEKAARQPKKRRCVHD